MATTKFQFQRGPDLLRQFRCSGFAGGHSETFIYHDRRMRRAPDGRDPLAGRTNGPSGARHLRRCRMRTDAVGGPRGDVCKIELTRSGSSRTVSSFSIPGSSQVWGGKTGCTCSQGKRPAATIPGSHRMWRDLWLTDGGPPCARHRHTVLACADAGSRTPRLDTSGFIRIIAGCVSSSRMNIYPMLRRSSV
jgi:hypothetical protein